MAPTVTTGAATGSKTGAEPPVLHTQDIIASLPAPVLRLLVLFSPAIRGLRQAIEVLCWKSGRRVESWMVVGAWWMLCLGFSGAFKWLFPPLLFAPLLPLDKLGLHHKPDPKQPTVTTPATPTTADILLVTLSDLHAIHALLPPSPLPTAGMIYDRFRLLGAKRLTRGFFVLWATWIVLSHTIGSRPLLGMLGSGILLLPSPSLAHAVDLLSKSLAVRRMLALAFLFTFGSPPEVKYDFSVSFSPLQWAKSKWAASRRPSLAFTFRPAMSKDKVPEHAVISEEDDEDAVLEKPGDPIYFRFEVHENQRWWMGLDWTSALLPQERPSWCDSHLLPVLPPPSYPLPSSSSIVLPSPTKADPGSKVKRIATWKWIDDDWAIVRAGPSAPPTSPSPNLGSALSPTLPAPSEPHDDRHPPESTSMHPARSLSIAGYTLGTSPPSASAIPGEEPSGSQLQMGAKAQSLAEQAFTKGLERLKARTTSPAASKTLPAAKRTSGELVRGRTGSQASEDSAASHGEHDAAGVAAPAASSTAPVPPGETVPDKDDATDADGWVYGDNKWEGMGPRGGLGKFTRRRRWQRRAVLIETVQRVPGIPGEAPASPGKTRPIPPTQVPPTSPLKAVATVTTSDVNATPLEVPREVDEKPDTDHSVLIPAQKEPQTRDDALRLRLKKAMSSVGG